MPDYSRHWWYIERPFPWPAIVAIALPVAIVVAALILGTVAAC